MTKKEDNIELKHNESESLYQRIGLDQIKKIVRSFYEEAFQDPMIGYFFFDKDLDDLVAKQISFVCVLLGDRTASYKGKSLSDAHKGLGIRLPHFKRRMVLLREAMENAGLSSDLAAQWLAKEQMLKDLVVF